MMIKVQRASNKLIFNHTISPMIATKKLAVLMMMTAMIIGVVGISAAASIPAAEAGSINTTRSNIKGGNIVQQDGDVSCTNQAQGQGGQQAVPNADPTAITEETDPIPGERADPIPGIDVKLGRNPGGSGAGAGVSSEGDPTVNAEQSNDCALEQNLTADQNAETGDDFSTNEWTE
jgi:hypothetical protein